MNNIVQPIKSFDEVLLETISKVVSEKKAKEIIEVLLPLLESKALVKPILKEDFANEILAAFGNSVLVRVSTLDEEKQLIYEAASVGNVLAFKKLEAEEARQEKLKSIFGEYIKA